MSARPVLATVPAVANGAIYQVHSGNRTLFEDFRARNIGDTITINLAEQTAANKTSNSAAEKQGSVAMGLPTVAGVGGKVLGLQGVGVNATSDNKFGATAASGTSTANWSVGSVSGRYSTRDSRNATPASRSAGEALT